MDRAQLLEARLLDPHGLSHLQVAEEAGNSEELQEAEQVQLLDELGLISSLWVSECPPGAKQTLDQGKFSVDVCQHLLLPSGVNSCRECLL